MASERSVIVDEGGRLNMCGLPWCVMVMGIVSAMSEAVLLAVAIQDRKNQKYVTTKKIQKETMKKAPKSNKYTTRVRTKCRRRWPSAAS